MDGNVIYISMNIVHASISARMTRTYRTYGKYISPINLLNDHCQQPWATQFRHNNPGLKDGGKIPTGQKHYYIIIINPLICIIVQYAVSCVQCTNIIIKGCELWCNNRIKAIRCCYLKKLFDDHPNTLDMLHRYRCWCHRMVFPSPKKLSTTLQSFCHINNCVHQFYV